MRERERENLVRIFQPNVPTIKQEGKNTSI